MYVCIYCCLLLIKTHPCMHVYMRARAGVCVCVHMYVMYDAQTRTPCCAFIEICLTGLCIWILLHYILDDPNLDYRSNNYCQFKILSIQSSSVVDKKLCSHCRVFYLCRSSVFWIIISWWFSLHDGKAIKGIGCSGLYHFKYWPLLWT